MFWIDQRNRVNAFSSRLVNIEWHFELKCLADGEVQLTGDAGNKFERSQDANGTEGAQIHVQVFLDDHRHKSAKSHHIHNPTLALCLEVHELNTKKKKKTPNKHKKRKISNWKYENKN